MPWIIGIDEAGYGPNLGPLVQTAVGFQLDCDPDKLDLWKRLSQCVRRFDQNGDRILIDDSKKVYSSPRGLEDLEMGVLATLFPTLGPLSALLESLASSSVPHIENELGFAADEPLPVMVEACAIADSAGRFRSACERAGIVKLWVRSRITPPARFNDLLEKYDSKAGVLADGVCELICLGRQPDDGQEPIHFFIDRQGGRWYHSAMLNNACPDGWIDVISENCNCSRYRMNGPRPLHWTFQVEGDSLYLPVALASMTSKYLREIFMRQFNRFWLEKVPGLKPTAGYPGDAARFYQGIKPVIAELGIEERRVWRKR
jgi:ribonuclease HII